jgi:DNA (cytosine-5)-methyltransferase 1
MTVPVIDLFAGPGGLGEGFARAAGARFEIAVSIEKDRMAHETLRLRAAHRWLMRSGKASRGTWAAWDRSIAMSSWETTFERLLDCDNETIREACRVAEEEAWHLELGPGNRGEVSAGIRRRLKRILPGSDLPDNTVLIGGPPCQAYSVVGRSRNRGTRGYKAERDHRHFLYHEYLHVIAEFRPAVFVMENVKGLLTSRVAGRQLFHSIIHDLRRPDLANGGDAGLHYVLAAFSQEHGLVPDPEPDDYIVEAERHGIPQARHRVFICGIRRDVFERTGGLRQLRLSMPPSVSDVIDDLPALRPKLSFRGRQTRWPHAIRGELLTAAMRELRERGVLGAMRVATKMERVAAELNGSVDPGTGTERVPHGQGVMLGPALAGWRRWYRDRPLALLANHESRAHMPADLVRYLFVSSWGAVFGESPKLKAFPKCLLPEHANVDPDNPEDAIFKDRFRVQVANRHSMTVTSHIAKDGHAFIHPDPWQCRSLTVREAARLQTFPDSYVFLGSRTSQYVQVGNAVPPRLALQIADSIATLLS